MKTTTIHSLLITLLACLLATACDSSGRGGTMRYSPYSIQNSYGLVADSLGVESVTDRTVTYNLADGSKSETLVQAWFDSDGRLVRGRDFENGTSWDYVYDKNGYLENVTDKSDYNAFFNENGDVVRETYKLGDDALMVEGISYEYDDHGYLKSIAFDESYYVSMENIYNADGQREKTITYDMDDRIETEYDDHGQPVGISVYDLSGDKEVLTDRFTYDYEYDSHGNWTKRTKFSKIKGFRKPKKIEETTRTLAYYSAPYGMTDEVSTALASYNPQAGFVERWVDDLSYRMRYMGYTSGASSVMLIILLLITVAVATASMWWIVKEGRFPGFSGERDENGMKRMWMYNWQPYASVGIIMADVLASFVVAILSMLIVGAVVWCLFGLVKLALMALLIVGYIMLIIGVLGLLAKEGFGCLGIIVGGCIVAAEDWIKRTGDQFVEWGDNFMSSVNMLGFGYEFAVNFWDLVLVVVLTPIVIFLAIAALFIILSFVLTGLEWIVTKIYSVRRPCPECSNTGKFDYMINGRPHPVALRPGLYGVFHQTRYMQYNTNGQYRVPTMLLNGRGRIDRRCAVCGAMISATGQHAVGTDVHIGFVGHVEAGKSYLIYGGLGSLMEKYPDRIEQINSGNNNSLDIATRSRQIAIGQSFKTDKRAAYRAVELMIDVSGRPIPYHVHFYDVAGEQFAGSSATSATDTAAMKFYSSVKSIVLVIDPLQLDLTAPGMNPSAEFERWQSEHNRSSRRYNIADIFSSLEGYLNHYGRSGSLKDIDVNIVVVKSDLGFFEALNYPAVPSEGDVESFVNHALGLQSLVNTAKKFRSVSFYATSAVSADRSALDSFFMKLLRQRGISL